MLFVRFVVDFFQVYETLRVFFRRKSIRMNCPSVIVLVKYALPRLSAVSLRT